MAVGEVAMGNPGPPPPPPPRAHLHGRLVVLVLERGVSGVVGVLVHVAVKHLVQAVGQQD